MMIFVVAAVAVVVMMVVMIMIMGVPVVPLDDSPQGQETQKQRRPTHGNPPFHPHC